MAKKRRIRCLLFDLGSTLWMKPEQAVVQAKEQVCAVAGALLQNSPGGAVFSAMDALTLGLLLHRAVGEQIQREHVQSPEYEPDYGLVTLAALRELGLVSDDRAFADALFAALRVRIPASRVLFADTLATLVALKQRGYILGVVTNRSYGGPLFHEDLHTMGLLDYFVYEHVAISADLGIRKPHPDIFWHALNGLHVSPTDAAMIGDNLLADIAGAQRLNIYTIWKPKPSFRVREEAAFADVADAPLPDATIAHLSELLELQALE